MCLLCLAVFTVVAGAVTKAMVDKLEQQLATVAADDVTRVRDTGSITLFMLDVPVPALPGEPPPTLAAAPVAVTVLKEEKRVQIQVRTDHEDPDNDVTDAQARAIQDVIAEACGLKVISRALPRNRHPSGEHYHYEQAASPDDNAEARPIIPPGRSGW